MRVQVTKIMDTGARHVLAAIANSYPLQLANNAFDKILEDTEAKQEQPSSSSLDLIQYLQPDSTDPAGQQGGCQPHQDKGLLTVIWSSSISGLQVRVCLDVLFCTCTAILLHDCHILRLTLHALDCCIQLSLHYKLNVYVYMNVWLFVGGKSNQARF